MSSIEEQPETKYSDEEEARAKKALEEIKAANETYAQKLKALNEKKLEVQVLQSETLEALQRATSLNEQFNITVNRQLLAERDKLQEEVKKLRLSSTRKDK